MDKFMYFQLCDHRIKKPKTDGEEREIIVKTGSGPIDVVINGAILLEVLEVRALEFNPNDVEIVDFYYDNTFREQTYDDIDPGEAFYDDAEQYYVDYSKYFMPNKKISEPIPSEYYEPILHNRIKWLVKPPLVYQVKAKVRFTHNAYNIYTPKDCPVCGGKGWFVDILDKDGRFRIAKGIEKVAQRVVKDLLTELGTQIYDLSYGTTIKKDSMLNSDDDEQLYNMVRVAVSDVEDGYISDQQEKITELPNDEILISLVTENVFRSTQNQTVIIVQIRIITQETERVFRIGF